MGGARGRGRPHFRWRDGVKEACESRSMGLATARGRCMNRREWRRVTDRIVNDGIV